MDRRAVVAVRWSLLAALLAGAACERRAARSDTRHVASAPDTLVPSAPAAEDNDGRPPLTVVFVGTSLTAGQGIEMSDAFPAVAGRMLDSLGLRVTVRNAGVSGETSAGALRRIDWPLSSPDIDVLVLETGANDGLRGLDLDSTRANLAALVGRVRARRPRARIVLVQMESPPNMGESYTRRFRAMFPAVAREQDVVLAPFLLEGVAGVDSLNQGDGIHPNEAGAKIAARNIVRVLEPILRQMVDG